MSKINGNQLDNIKKLYYTDHLCMREIADNIGVTINAVIYFMRKNGLPRRSFSEINKQRFDDKQPSFEISKGKSVRIKELKAVGAMLYWGEGYKSEKSSSVDFANSDPEMISVFLHYLRDIYSIDESRLRVLLYCHANQNTDNLIKYWSDLTKIKRDQFTKPYIREDFNSNNRKMEHGLIHIRYSDKKLLLEIKKSIKYYTGKYK